MSIVSEWVVRRVWAGLAEEVERQIKEDDARGPEPEGVTRTLLPVGRAGAGGAWVAAPPPAVGGDELRVRVLLCRVLGVVA